MEDKEDTSNTKYISSKNYIQSINNRKNKLSKGYMNVQNKNLMKKKEMLNKLSQNRYINKIIEDYTPQKIEIKTSPMKITSFKELIIKQKNHSLTSSSSNSLVSQKKSESSDKKIESTDNKSEPSDKKSEPSNEKSEPSNTTTISTNNKASITLKKGVSASAPTTTIRKPPITSKKGLTIKHSGNGKPEKQVFRRRTTISNFNNQRIHSSTSSTSISYIPFVKSLSTPQPQSHGSTLPQTNSNPQSIVSINNRSNNNNNNSEADNKDNNFKSSTKLLKHDFFISSSNSSTNLLSSETLLSSNSSNNPLSNLTYQQKRELLHTSPTQNNFGLRSSLSRSNSKILQSSSSSSSSLASSSYSNYLLNPSNYTSSETLIKSMVPLALTSQKLKNNLMESTIRIINTEDSNDINLPNVSVKESFPISESMPSISTTKYVNNNDSNKKEMSLIKRKSTSGFTIPKLSSNKNSSHIISISLLSLTPSYSQQQLNKSNDMTKSNDQIMTKPTRKLQRKNDNNYNNNNSINNNSNNCNNNNALKQVTDDNTEKENKQLASKEGVTETSESTTKPIIKELGLSISKVKLEENKKENELNDSTYSNLHSKLNNSSTTTSSVKVNKDENTDSEKPNSQLPEDKEYTPFSTISNLYNYDNNIYYNISNIFSEDRLLSSESFLSIKKNKLNNKEPASKITNNHSNDNINKTNMNTNNNNSVKGKNKNNVSSNKSNKDKLYHNSNRRKGANRSSFKTPFSTRTKSRKENKSSIKINNKITVNLTNVNDNTNNAYNYNLNNNNNNYNYNNNYNNNTNIFSSIFSGNKDNNNNIRDKQLNKKSTLNRSNNSLLNFIGIPNLNNINITPLSVEEEKLNTPQNYMVNLPSFSPSLTIEIPISDDIPEISY